MVRPAPFVCSVGRAWRRSARWGCAVGEVGQQDSYNRGDRTRRVPGVAISRRAGARKSASKVVGTTVGFHETRGMPTLQTTSTSSADFRHLSERWCVRWVPTPLTPPLPSGRQGENCTMRASTCLRHADRRRPLSQESGSAGVPLTSGWLVVKGARRGKSSRSVFARLGSPASGAGCVS